MNRTKYIVRGTLLFLIVFQLVQLNTKTDDAFERISKFKYETFNKVKADSLGTKQKVDLLITETAKFDKQMTEDSPHIQKSIHRLIGIVVVLIVAELVFLLARRSKTDN